jgi:hypothetical protein
LKTAISNLTGEQQPKSWWTKLKDKIKGWRRKEYEP